MSLVFAATPTLEEGKGREKRGLTYSWDLGPGEPNHDGPTTVKMELSIYHSPGRFSATLNHAVHSTPTVTPIEGSPYSMVMSPVLYTNMMFAPRILTEPVKRYSPKAALAFAEKALATLREQETLGTPAVIDYLAEGLAKVTEAVAA